ncbi:MAG: single-stranded DNA-binding protein [Cyanobacteriota bacterium]
MGITPLAWMALSPRSTVQPGRRGSIEIWGKQAQVAADYVRKGSLIGIVGRMTSEQWTDRNTGEVRSKPLVKAERLALLGSRSGTQQPADSSPAPAAAPPEPTAPAPAAPLWSSSTPLSEDEVPF